MHVPDQQAESAHADQHKDEGDEEFGGGGDNGKGLGSEDSGEEVEAAHFLYLGQRLMADWKGSGGGFAT